MPWLIVTGSGGSWGAGRNLPTFKPGVYEVTEEVAEIARRDAPERVFVSAVRPELATCHEGAPLTLEDIRVGVDYGVRLRQDDAPADPDQDDEYVEPERLPDAYPCQFCTRSFATGERLDWHVEYAHSIHHEQVVTEQEEKAAERQDAEEEEDLLAQAKVVAPVNARQDVPSPALAPVVDLG